MEARISNAKRLVQVGCGVGRIEMQSKREANKGVPQDMPHSVSEAWGGES